MSSGQTTISGKDCVIVTGASRGIGAAIAYRLSDIGYHVACLSRSGREPEIAQVAQEVRSRWYSLPCDVTDPESLDEALSRLSEKGYRVAGLVNNAGLHVEARAQDMSLADWEILLRANATSVLLGCQAAFEHLVSGGGGLIVNIGSFFDKLGVKRNAGYCASKAAVASLTRCLAVEWAAHGIRVLDVAPGYIVTDLNRQAMESGPLRAYLDKRIPHGAPGQADDVARVVAGLFQMDCRFLSGETIYVDGGQGIAH